jgi:hypothetical protein
MDTPDSLARALAVVHHLLGDVVAWRRIIDRALEGSANHRAALRGVREDLALRAATLITRTRPSGVNSDGSTDGRSSTAVVDFCPLAVHA